jgi:hypothetical protein
MCAVGEIKWDLETMRDVQNAEISEEAETASGQERCTMPFALTAVQHVKSLSSQLKEDLFIAGTVGRNTRLTRRR